MQTCGATRANTWQKPVVIDPEECRCHEAKELAELEYVLAQRRARVDTITEQELDRMMAECNLFSQMEKQEEGWEIPLQEKRALYVEVFREKIERAKRFPGGLRQKMLIESLETMNTSFEERLAQEGILAPPIELWRR